MSKTSVVWNYFKLDDKKKNVKCGLCRLEMKHNQTSTSNMMRHMRLKHSTIDLNKRRPSNMHVEENNVDDPVAIENQLASTSVSILCTFPTDEILINKVLTVKMQYNNW